MVGTGVVGVFEPGGVCNLAGDPLDLFGRIWMLGGDKKVAVGQGRCLPTINNPVRDDIGFGFFNPDPRRNGPPMALPGSLGLPDGGRVGLRQTDS